MRRNAAFQVARSERLKVGKVKRGKRDIPFPMHMGAAAVLGSTGGRWILRCLAMLTPRALTRRGAELPALSCLALVAIESRGHVALCTLIH